eukprot:9470199-Pyramimonas_sp.AAC.1
MEWLAYQGLTRCVPRVAGLAAGGKNAAEHLSQPNVSVVEHLALLNESLIAASPPAGGRAGGGGEESGGATGSTGAGAERAAGYRRPAPVYGDGQEREAAEQAEGAAAERGRRRLPPSHG